MAKQLLSSVSVELLVTLSNKINATVVVFVTSNAVISPVFKVLNCAFNRMCTRQVPCKLLGT